jgi:hypothetical protein
VAGAKQADGRGGGGGPARWEAGPDDDSGLRIDLWGRLRPEKDEAGGWDTPYLAAPDPLVNLG